MHAFATSEQADSLIHIRSKDNVTFSSELHIRSKDDLPPCPWLTAGPSLMSDDARARAAAQHDWFKEAIQGQGRTFKGNAAVFYTGYDNNIGCIQGRTTTCTECGRMPICDDKVVNQTSHGCNQWAIAEEMAQVLGGSTMPATKIGVLMNQAKKNCDWKTQQLISGAFAKAAMDHGVKTIFWNNVQCEGDHELFNGNSVFCTHEVAQMIGHKNVHIIVMQRGSEWKAMMDAISNPRVNDYVAAAESVRPPIKVFTPDDMVRACGSAVGRGDGKKGSTKR